VPGVPGELVLKAEPYEDVFLLSGELEAVRADHLDPPRSDTWRVQVKWMAEDGAEVKAGDPVIQFDNSSISAGLEEKRLAWLQSEIAMESREAALEGEQADKRLALDKALHEESKARIKAEVPAELSKRSEWEDSQIELHRAQAEVQKARLQIESFEKTSKADMDVLRIARDSAQRDIDEAERQLGGFSLKAPRDGIFIVGENQNEDRKFQVGDMAWPGMSVGSIPELGDMVVAAKLSDVDDGRIAAGMPARCVLDTYPDRVFEGRVESIGSIADRTGFRVRIVLTKADADLMRPGMSVRAEVVRRAWPAALVVPRQAIRRDGGKSFVRVAGAENPVEVQLASCTPTGCVIESGVAEGARIVVR
jgi:multidrug efflux pump subunit AcrA (membrane-fusion protein)